MKKGILLFFLFFSKFLVAEESKKTFELGFDPKSKSEWVVGEKISLHPKVDPSLGEWNFSLPEGTSKLEDMGWVLYESQTEKNTYEVIPVKDGKIIFPVLEVRSKKDKEILGYTNSFQIEVKSLLKTKKEAGDEEGIQFVPPRGPYEFSIPWLKLVGLAILVIVLLAALVYAVLLLLKKFKPQNQFKDYVPEKEILPPDVVALKKLRILEEKAYWKQGELKKHYFGVSEILKEYLGARFGFEAEESTTEELIDRLRTRPVSKELQSEIQNMMLVMDVVKFTDQKPKDAQEPVEILDQTEKMILKTKEIKSAL